MFPLNLICFDNDNFLHKVFLITVYNKDKDKVNKDKDVYFNYLNKQLLLF